MPWGAAAIVGAAAIGAISSNSAANKQEAAENQANATEVSQFNTTQANEKPFLNAADTALGQITTGEAPGGQYSTTFSGLGTTPAQIEANDPGYQFRMDQGMRGVDAGAAAAGGVLSGGTLKAEQEFGQDYASNEYQNAFNRFQTNQTNSFNRLASTAGLGQTAANTDAAAGSTAANAEAATEVGAGNAAAGGTVGVGNNISGAGTSLANLYQQNQLLAKLNGTGGSPTSSYTGPGYVSGSDSSGYNGTENNISSYVGGG